MPKQELVDYIKQQKEIGVSDGGIKSALLTAGWQENEINEALNFLMTVQSLDTQIKPKKKRRWLKVLLITSSIIIVPILLLVVIVFILRNINADGPPVDDSDLQLQTISIPDSENSYFDLKDILNSLSGPPAGDSIKELADINNYLSGQSWDDATIAQNIEDNRQALAVFDQAAAKSYFQVPDYADSSKFTPNRPLVAYNWLRVAVRQKALKALYLMKHGQDKDAFDELYWALKVAQNVQNSQGPLIQYLVGTAMKDLTIKAIQDVSKTTTLNSTDLIEYVNKLSQFSENAEGLKTAFKGEYLTMTYFFDLLLGLKGTDQERKDFIESLGTDINYLGVAKSNFYFELNNTKSLWAENCRQQIKSVDLPYNPEISEFNYTPSVFTIYFTRNVVGKILSSIALTSLNSVVYRKDVESVNLEITQLLLAIKAYKLDSGDYPVDLNQLTPKYLTSIPSDPFSQKGSQLLYSKEKMTISTVGPAKENLDAGIKSISEYKLEF